jgi:hypothetical protein
MPKYRALLCSCLALCLETSLLERLPADEFLRGDSNSSGTVDISDAIFTLGCLFGGGGCPACYDAADANDSGTADISDAVFTLSHLFSGGAPPPAPFPAPGFDTTPTDPFTCGDPPIGGSPGSIIISEIHYHPLSEDSSDEFVELYNRGNGRVSLDGWRFSKGIDYTFAGTSMEPGSYLVVAANAARIKQKYGITNVVGDYLGVLDDGGETIRIKDAAGNTITETKYDDSGGLWPRDADGYGSSLELIDLHADGGDYQAWAASDETLKAQWTPFQIRQTATGSSSEIHLLLISDGECLVDNLEVLVNNQSRLANGSFETGMTGWIAQGTHRLSSVTSATAVAGTNALQIVATGRGDTSPNRIEHELTTPVSNGQVVTLSGSTRWISGSRFLLVRLQGNAVAQTLTLSVPDSGGTPGGPNSVRLANRGPDISTVAHAPVLPTSTQTVTVTAFVQDIDGIGSVKLHYRVEPSATETVVSMNDGGLSGDAAAGDEIYSANLPRQTNGKMVAFWISAADTAGTESVFPREAPGLTCLYRVGEPNPASQLARYHIWLPQATVAGLTNGPKMGNEPFDITFVLDNTQVFYNSKIRYRGSPFIRAAPPTDPVGGRYAYRIDFGGHQPLDGRAEINLDNIEPGRDPTIQREHAAYVLFRELGLPYSQFDYVRMWINGNDHGVYADVRKVDKDYVKVFWPDDAGGNLHKIDDYFEFDDNGGFSNRDAHLTDFGSKKEEYRWNFEKRDNDRNDDFSQVQSLAHLMNSSGAAYESSVEQAINPEEWCKVLAIQKIIGNWDSFGYNRGKNMFMYRPPIEGRWNLITWDMDFLLGNGDGPSTPLFGGIDSAVNTFLAYPKYKRLYLKAFRDLVDGPFRNEFLNPILDQTYNLLRAETSVADPSAVKSFITQRRNYVLSQLPAAQVIILTNNGNDFSTSETSVTIEGDAPLEVEKFRLNGSPITPTITGISKWSFTRSIPLGTTSFLVEGLTAANALVGSDSLSVLRVAPCVPMNVDPPSVPQASVTLTIHGNGFQAGTTPVVRLASASTEAGFSAFYAQGGASFGDVNQAETFLNNPGAVQKVTTTHLTISRKTEGGGEIFPTQPFPAPWNTGSVNNLAARYTGFLHAPSPGLRTLGVHSDDGFRLKINGVVAAEWPPPRGPATTTAAVNFPSAGTYALQLDWYENGGTDLVQLFQETAGGARKLINDGSELTVTLDDPIIVQGTNVQVVDSGTLTADFDLSGAELGSWSLEMTPAQGSVCRLQGAVTIE